MLDIASKAYVESDPFRPNYDDYFAQDEVTVTNGRFTSAQFDDRGRPLSPGPYRASVLMPYPRTQPSGVRAVIGKRGERLRGVLVKRDAFGAIVEVQRWFTVR